MKPEHRDDVVAGIVGGPRSLLAPARYLSRADCEAIVKRALEQYPG